MTDQPTEVEWSTCARCGQGIWLTAESVWCATEWAKSAVCYRSDADIFPHVPQRVSLGVLHTIGRTAKERWKRKDQP